ncbi:hypothetical protein VU02_02215, partial [Desulfobulbus sp. N2]|nr:hypothetical protein [Desulfobulbus sp. N2]
GKYEGECRDGFAHGIGISKGEDIYSGEFVNGYMEGKGIYTYSNEIRYEGNFSRDSALGFGAIIYNNGDRLEGNFSNGQVSDGGVLYYSNGDKYEGEFVDNLPHGKGSLLSTNKKYVGFFSKGKKDGEGMIFSAGENGELLDSDENVVKFASYKNGKLEKKSEMTIMDVEIDENN